MGDEEGHGGTSSGSSATVAQPSTSQSPMFHQISPPQPLSLRPSGEVADNWKFWKEKYHRQNIFIKMLSKHLATLRVRIRIIGAW